MIKCPVLYWFIIIHYPFWTQNSIINLNKSRSNKIISKQQIIIPSFDYKRARSRETLIEFKTFVELWIRLIILTLISLVYYNFSTFNNEVWIAKSIEIFWWKIFSIKHVQSHNFITFLWDWFLNHISIAHFKKVVRYYLCKFIINFNFFQKFLQFVFLLKWVNHI